MTRVSHTTLPTPPDQVQLRVWFDVDQQGEQLGYDLVRENPITPNPQPGHGPNADSMYFAAGEQVSLQVTCSGKAGDFDAFQIIDCVIVTRPQLVQLGAGLPTRYAAPSPFLQAIGACYPMALDFQASVDLAHQKETGERVVVQDWKRTLDIGWTPGRWDLSFSMTVRITRGGGTIDEVRVLGFDPESEVGGTGTIK